MESTEIILMAMATENLVYMLLYGSVFNRLRSWWFKLPYIGTLASCPLCLSFWAALFVTVFSPWTLIYILGIQGASRYIFMLMDFIGKKDSQIDIID